MSEINYQNEMAVEQAKADADRLEAANRAVFDEILARYAISENEANYQMFRSFANPMTVEACEYLLKGNVSGFTLSWSSRDKIIEELANKVRDNTTQKTLSAYDWKQLVIRMSTWSLRQLRSYKREIEFKHSHNAQQAREYLTNARKEEPNPFPGWPRLPKRMVLPHGPIAYTELNAEFFRNLARTDYYMFKNRFVKIYGADQITARMNNEA
jgi:hypothetical protein